MAADFLAILPLIVVAGWASLLLLADLFVPAGRKGLTGLLAALGLVAALGLTILRFGEERLAFGGMLYADGFASFLDVLFLFAGIFATTLAHDYLKRTGLERGEYYALLLFVISGMMMMAHSGDLIMLFIGLETLSIPLYVMAGLARPKAESEEAALKYFLLGAFASSFEVYGIALIFGATTTTRLAGIVGAAQAGTADGLLLVLGAVLILISLSFKVAVVPFHMWTPDVYQGAPTPVSAFMSVGAKAGGFAGLLRVFLLAFPALAASWAPAVLWVAVLTMIWGNVAALVQPNIKRLLAYSSIAHAGYILMALPAAADPRLGPAAVGAALFYLFAYAITNLGAWGVVVALESSDGKGLHVDDYAGLGVRHPWLALAMVLFMLSLTGVPPSVGFVAKFYLFSAVIDAGLIGLALVGVLTSLISAAYYLRVVVVMYMRSGEPPVRREGWLYATVGLMAAATLALGLLPTPLYELAARAGLITLLP
ncbi:MAG: NADH-quinone oxidoreductase subunit N [Chloroflexi bacterium]|nr:NADH-quinone oxidoreductase subunit N [Chloroflexota bacterium]